jgi:hypothetical protein
LGRVANEIMTYARLRAYLLLNWRIRFMQVMQLYAGVAEMMTMA